jgi:predicted dehydrogenase/threonine dehydrogenase-like Zn-dependent dehydrogenase
VQVAYSLVSAGTERMVVDFAEKNLLDKARSRPDLVSQTINKVKREGLLTTIDAVRNKLDQPMALGYSCAGRVIEVGDDVSGLEKGDLVACAGGGHASHAEVVLIPKNLVVKLPSQNQILSEKELLEGTAYTTLGAIALQGIRLADVKLGEVVAVIGLGLLGQLTVQILKSAGCIVVGTDLQPERVALACELGANIALTDPEILYSEIQRLTSGQGADAVLITADTKSNQPVELAGELARSKGIVVAVGAVGMTIPRKVYYEKELDFRISRSYGPGRYDLEYEENGKDYPYPYVRWTEQRNMQAFVQLVADGKVNTQKLTTHRFLIDDAAKAYEVITGKTSDPFLGVLLKYPEQVEISRKVVISPQGAVTNKQVVRENINAIKLGLLGAGNFAMATLLPAVKGLPNIEMIGVASGSGVTARAAADRFGFNYCASDSDEILNDPAVNTVAILTRHHLHARQVVAALKASKHVFVEKPLCLNEEELAQIISTYQELSNPPLLMVGFNRRFAPFIIELKKQLALIVEPLMLNYRVNAGYIPVEHWTQDPMQGGGRLLGEGCHFIDLLIHLAGSKTRSISAKALPDGGRYRQDNFVITIEFENGSLGTVTYVANGNKSSGKEYLEVYGGGVTAKMDDYRELTIYQGSQRIHRKSRLRQDKGHRAEWEAISNLLTKQGSLPISFDSVIESTQATLNAQHSLTSGKDISVQLLATHACS